ncbi:MAG: hypothetical protein JF627_05355 [Alphaproteobacteria bacterium]|nr:hypothetical protein [Alphaproteobacteria bacterium]
MKASRSLLLVALAASLLLSGCSVLDEVGSWFSSSGKKSNLRGVRIPVMSLDADLKPDATLATTPVWRRPAACASCGARAPARATISIPISPLRQWWRAG